MKCDTDDVRVKEQEKDWFDGCRRREEKNERCDDEGRKEQEEELTVGWRRKEEEEEKCEECGRWERDEWRKERVELDGCWTQRCREEWMEEEEELGDDDDEDEGRKE